MTRTEKDLRGIILMAESNLHGLKTKTTPNTPELRREIRGAFNSLVPGFDAGEIEHELEQTS